ncbi:MAG: cytochrome c5 family protein [Legionella sp.]|nr:cytochrome c5 family protein [Legionella sp.]
MKFLFVVLSMYCVVFFAQTAEHNQQSNDSNSVALDKQVKIANKQDNGQNTYEHFCINCHQDGVAGAPKINDKADWNLRLTNRTIEDLVSTAMNGLNNMPAQGTCFECTTEDLKAAIQYMLPTHD